MPNKKFYATLKWKIQEGMDALMEEQYTFRHAIFGGFSAQDVVQYIEKTAKRTSQAQEKLQQENSALHTQIRQLTAQIQSLTAQRDHLQQELQTESADRKALAPFPAQAQALQTQVEQLSQKLTSLQPDAEAYAQFREQIGRIECEARERAADLEREVTAQLEQITADFRKNYHALRLSFDTAAAHATSELHKIEVQLVQLPRTMDQIEKDLEQLESALHTEKNS